MQSEFPLNKPEDWEQLRTDGLTTVIDPMIYRAGELFLGGRSRALDEKATWNALS